MKKRRNATHKAGKNRSPTFESFRSRNRRSTSYCQSGFGLPGRGLEPLRIAPPDPKSGASANFATLAGCDGHEGRFVSSFGQIALVSLLRFLRQIESWLHKSLAGPFSSLLSSAHRGKAA